MRTFLIGALFCFYSSSAMAGSGGMVGGGKWPSSLKLVIPEMDLGFEAKVFHVGKFKILSVAPEARDALVEAAGLGMYVEVQGDVRIGLNMDLDVLENGVVVLKEENEVHAFALESSAE